MAYGNGGAVTSNAGQFNPRDMERQGIAKEPPRPSHVGEQLLTLEKSCHVLHDIITELEARLSGVLVSEPPDTVKANEQHMDVVPLAASLYAQNDQMARAIVRLRRLNERIEL